MKKLYLFTTPLATIATVIPMVSCSSSKTEVDLTKPFSPSIKKHDAAKYTIYNALKEYSIQAASNKQIIADDYFNYMHDIYEPYKSENWSETCTVKASKISINKDQYLLSGTFEFHRHGFYKEGDLFKEELKSNSVVKISNIPFGMKYLESKWYVGFDTTLDNWLESADCTVTGDYTYTLDGKTNQWTLPSTFIYRYTVIDTENEKLAYSILQNTYWYSYYFSDVTCQE